MKKRSSMVIILSGPSTDSKLMRMTLKAKCSWTSLLMWTTWIQTWCVLSTKRNYQRNCTTVSYTWNSKKEAITTNRWCMNMRDSTQNSWQRASRMRRKRLNYSKRSGAWTGCSKCWANQSTVFHNSKDAELIPWSAKPSFQLCSWL